MLYFKVLQQGIASMPRTDPNVRKKLEKIMHDQGLATLHEKLKQIDPVAATRIHPNDPQRLLRALEVYEISGRSLTQWHEEAEERDSGFPYRVVALAMTPHDRKILHDRISLRFRQMLAMGLVEEVGALRVKYHQLVANCPAMRAVGYRQVWAYLEGQYDYEQMVNRGIIATRQLAKRQLTWLRSWPSVEWFDSEDPQLIQRVQQKLTSIIEGGTKPTRAVS